MYIYIYYIYILMKPNEKVNMDIPLWTNLGKHHIFWLLPASTTHI